MRPLALRLAKTEGRVVQIQLFLSFQWKWKYFVIFILSYISFDDGLCSRKLFKLLFTYIDL